MMRRLAAAFSLLRGVPRQAGLGLLLLTLLLGPAPGRAAGRVAAQEGYTREYLPVANRFASIDAVLYTPATPIPDLIVLFAHPWGGSLDNVACKGLAQRGVTILCFNGRYTNQYRGAPSLAWHLWLRDVAAAVQEARDRGYGKVVLFGMSAGGATMASYEYVAERGNAAFTDPDQLYPFDGYVDAQGNELRLPRVDGLVLGNAIPGMAESFLLGLDAAVTDEEHPRAVDPNLDMSAAQNGFDPQSLRATYTPEFLQRYRRAQAERMARLVATAQDRYQQVQAGQGSYPDNDLLVVPHAFANPWMVDTTLASRTQGRYLLLPAGQVDEVRSVRPAASGNYRTNQSLGGAYPFYLTTLLGRAVRVDPARYDAAATRMEDTGIDHRSAIASTVWSLNQLDPAVPLIIFEGTGDALVNLPSAELNLNSAAARDKQLVFVEGGEHFTMAPVDPSFGDTEGIYHDAIAHWLRERY